MTFNTPSRSTLAVHRYAAGLSQARLARLANVRQETISRVETGRVEPRARTRAAIAAVLDVDEQVLWPEVTDG